MDDAKHVVQTAVGVSPVAGNTVEVLRNGNEIFPSMLDAIRGAQRSVLLSTYVYWTGDIAEEVASALAERARDGVEVRVLVDWVGGRLMSDDLIETITEAGGQFAWFRPPSRIAQAALSMDEGLIGQHRTHRKILVCDGRVGFTGGVGIAEEWTGDAREPGEWRDTHLRFEGPVVGSLASAFTTNWQEATGERIGPELVPPTGPVGDVDVQVVRGQPGRFMSDVGLVVHALLAAATDRVWVETAYLVPDEVSLGLLQDAVGRGVDVRVLVPGPHCDKRVSRLAARAAFEPMLEAGVEVFEYQPTMLHCKVLVIDDVAVVGSANLNMRSTQQDDEVIAVVHGGATVETLAEHLREDLEQAERMEPGRFEQRGLSERAGEQAVDIIRRFL